MFFLKGSGTGSSKPSGAYTGKAQTSTKTAPAPVPAPRPGPAPAPAPVMLMEQLIRYDGEITHFDIEDWVKEYVANKEAQGLVKGRGVPFKSDERDIPKNLFRGTAYEGFVNEIENVNTLGRGDCGVHAFFTCASPTYRKIPSYTSTGKDFKLEMVADFREQVLHRFYRKGVMVDRTTGPLTHERVLNEEWVGRSGPYLTDDDFARISEVIEMNVILVSRNVIQGKARGFVELRSGVSREKGEARHEDWPTCVFYGDGTGHWEACRWGNRFWFNFADLPAGVREALSQYVGGLLNENPENISTKGTAKDVHPLDFLEGKEVRFKIPDPPFLVNGRPITMEDRFIVESVARNKFNDIAGKPMVIIGVTLTDFHGRTIEIETPYGYRVKAIIPLKHLALVSPLNAGKEEAQTAAVVDYYRTFNIEPYLRSNDMPSGYRRDNTINIFRKGAPLEKAPVAKKATGVNDTEAAKIYALIESYIGDEDDNAQLVLDLTERFLKFNQVVRDYILGNGINKDFPKLAKLSKKKLYQWFRGQLDAQNVKEPRRGAIFEMLHEMEVSSESDEPNSTLAELLIIFINFYYLKDIATSFAGGRRRRGRKTRRRGAAKKRGVTRRKV